MTRPLGTVPDAALSSSRLVVSSQSFPCPPFIILRNGMPYRRPLYPAGHGATAGSRFGLFSVLSFGAPLSSRGPALHVRAFGFDRGSPERPPDDRRHVFLAAGNGGSPMSLCSRWEHPRTHLRRQIRKEWPRLEVPVGLSDRSTVGRRPVPPRRVSTGPPPCGEPHQPYAATCQPSQQQGQPQSKPRLFYKIAPQFLVNQPAIQISSN